MSMNALSSTRFAPPPQQARLNPHVAQQREGVTFPEQETKVAFNQFGQIMHQLGQIIRVVAVSPDNAVTYHLHLYDSVRDGLKALIGNKEDSFKGLFQVIPSSDRLSMSQMIVSLHRENHDLGEGAEPLMRSFAFYPFTDYEEVQNAFGHALDFVIRSERDIADQKLREKISNQVPDQILQAIRKDAEALFGESGANFTLNA